jgi:HTTM domain
VSDVLNARWARFAKAWRQFWFAEIPPHLYALLRILLGTIGFLSLVGLRDIGLYWSLDGIVPPGDVNLPLKALTRSAGLEQIVPPLLFLTPLLAFAAMAVGLWTGTSVTLALIFSLVQLSWNNLPLSGVQGLMHGLLFCLIWTDCGVVWSVDAWLERRRGKLPVTPPLQPIAPLRLMRYQVALLYLSSGLWKLLNPLWRDGSALYYVLNNNLYHRVPFFVPPEWQWVLTASTYLVLLWEIGFAFAVWYPPTRRIVIALGILIHLGMMTAIEIGPFSLVVLSAYWAFADPHKIPALFQRIGRLRAKRDQTPFSAGSPERGA